ncbi:MAG: hypothetical protein IPO25_23045 [Saprospiraceae bacterium]|nr:hypothetical protein [Saprospiraceae bacterium]
MIQALYSPIAFCLVDQGAGGQLQPRNCLVIASLITARCANNKKRPGIGQSLEFWLI